MSSCSVKVAVKPQRSRVAQRQETRSQLLRAGLRVVADHGFAAATTAAIAAASGKSHGTVFVHFRTREALVDELVALVGTAISQRLADVPNAAPSVPDVIDAHLIALQENEVLYARLLGEATTLPLSARARVFALQSGIAWRLREALERDVVRGAARAMDPVALANLWIALTNHYLLNRDLFAPGKSVVAARGADLKAQLLDIIRP
jgi:AcrR family transcriptional regulator